MQASNYGSAVVTIDASSRTKAIDITGNTKNNSIKGGSGNDTLSGGTGDDTITGGNGKDLFVYASGNDVITDFTAGQDTLKISSGSISGYSFSGDDAIFTIGKGSVTVSGSKNSVVTVVDSKKKTFTYQNGLIQDNSAVAKAKAVTVTAANSGTVTAADYGAAVVTIDASSRTAAVNITGNTKNNKIIGTAGNDTLSGGSGKNTLTGGKGNDLFIYSGGNDVITDYTSGDDTIQIASGTISSYSVSSKDLSLKIGKNTLKVTGGKTATLTILDAENNVNVYQGGLIYGGEIASATALSVTSVYGNTLSSYGANVEVIDASERSKALNITGNAKANQITGTKKNDKIDGGAGADTIEGGKGNDVLTGGAGNDIFIYTDGDGKDTITDYAAGDVISLSGDYNISYSYSSAKGGTSTFKIGKSGSIAVKNSANAVVTLIGANGEASIGIKDNFLAVSDIPGFSPGSGTNETIYVTVPAETVNVTMPAETVTVGGGGSSVLGTTGNDTLYGTSGNDTFYGGAGNDVFVYSGGSDYDVITDYTPGADKILFTSAMMGAGMVFGNDVIWALGDGILKVKDAKNKKVTVTYGDNDFEYVNGILSSDTNTGGDDSLDVDYDGETVTLAADNKANFNLNTYNSTASVKAVNINASLDNNDIAIYGDDSANIIWAGKQATTIFGALGNDVIYCGRAVDLIYYYTDGGNDTIYDYKTGDKIYMRRIDQYDDTTFQNVSLSGNDVIINFTNGNKMTLKDAKDQRISIAGGNYNYEVWESHFYTYNNTFGKVSISEDTVSLQTDYVGNMSTWYYAGSVTNVDGSSATNAVDIYANNSANTIKAAQGGGYVYSYEGDDLIYGSEKGDNTIYSGAGNDTIHCGKGSSTIFGSLGDDVIYCGRGVDLIYYYTDGGNDTIYDYKTGDKIYMRRIDQYDDTTFQNVSLSGNDVIINFTNGNKMTLKDAKDQRISIVGGNYNYEVWESHFYTYNFTYGRVSISGGTASLKADYAGVFRAFDYAENITTIDGSAATLGTDIYDNEKSNVIKAAKGGGRIVVGNGNDTIYCGAGVDSIIFYDGGGNDTVYNIGNGDGVYLNNCTADNVSVNGTDVIIITNNSEKITLKEAIGKSIFITGKGTQTYSSVTTSADIIDDFWFTEDNNFVSSGGDLDSIVDENNSLANLNFNPVDADNIFAQDKPAISYNLDKEK